MKYLFEDNIEKFPYELLKMEFGNYLFGARSNNNLPKLCRNDFIENTYVFIDVNADNPNTVATYNKLAKEATGRQRQYIIPIPSIEYYFVKAFVGYANTEFSTILTFGNYKQFGSSNYENCIKDMLKRHKSCYSSRLFEKVPCLCESSYTDCNTMSVSIKCKKFELSLPIILSKQYTDEVIRHVIDLQKNLYYEQANRFLELGIINKILELKF